MSEVLWHALIQHPQAGGAACVETPHALSTQLSCVPRNKSVIGGANEGIGGILLVREQLYLAGGGCWGALAVVAADVPRACQRGVAGDDKVALALKGVKGGTDTQYSAPCKIKPLIQLPTN